MSHSNKIRIQMQLVNLLLTTVCHFFEVPGIKTHPCPFIHSPSTWRSYGQCFSDKTARTVATPYKQVQFLGGQTIWRGRLSEPSPVGEEGHHRGLNDSQPGPGRNRYSFHRATLHCQGCLREIQGIVHWPLTATKPQGLRTGWGRETWGPPESRKSLKRWILLNYTF